MPSFALKYPLPLLSQNSKQVATIINWTILIFLFNSLKLHKIIVQENLGGIASIPEDQQTQKLRGADGQNPNLKTLVRCFPLYSILLAIGNPTIDLFSLDIEGKNWSLAQI